MGTSELHDSLQRVKLTGEYERIFLPQAIVLPVRQRLTGVLELTSDKIKRNIFYRNGWPIHATSTAVPESPTAQLLRQKLVALQNLRTLESTAMSEGIPIFAAGVKAKLISANEAMGAQIELEHMIVLAALITNRTDIRFLEKTPGTGMSPLPLLEYVEEAIAQFEPTEREVLVDYLRQESLCVVADEMENASLLSCSFKAKTLLEKLSRAPLSGEAWLDDDAANITAGLMLVLTQIVGPADRAAPQTDDDLDRAIDALSEPHALVEEPTRHDAPLPVVRARQSSSQRNEAIDDESLSTFDNTQEKGALHWLVSGGVMALLAAAAFVFLRPPTAPAPPTQIEPPRPASASVPVTVQPSSAPASVPARIPVPIAAPKPAPPALALDPATEQRTVELFKRGNALVERRKFIAAVNAYRAALALAPESAALHRALGIAYLRGGAYQQGTAELRLYLGLAPDAPDAEEVRALIKN